jgi:hypothetical protein
VFFLRSSQIKSYKRKDCFPKFFHKEMDTLWTYFLQEVNWAQQLNSMCYELYGIVVVSSSGRKGETREEEEETIFFF